MKDRDYAGIWNSLTAKSRDTIVDDTYKAIAKSGGKEIPKEDIRKDFSTSGPLAKSYWGSFLRHFDPVLALEQSTWTQGTIGNDRAEIFITYRKSKNPAQVRLFKENGAWKVGLTETFWGPR